MNGRLRVISEKDSGEFEISLGSYTIGRTRQSDIRLSHKGVSRQHCRLNVEADRVHVVDLGSSLGTFIDDEPVSEGILRPGGTLRVGKIDILFEQMESEKSPGPSATPSADIAPDSPEDSGKLPKSPPTSGKATKTCQKHPPLPLTLVCPKCNIPFCEKCVSVFEVAGKQKCFCPFCKSTVTSLENHSAERKLAKARTERSFFQMIPNLLTYPFTTDGISLLLLGTLLYLVLDFAALFDIRVAIIASGYLFAYMQKIIICTAAGEEELPAWPDLREWWLDIVRPCLMMLWTGAVSFGPAFIYMIASAQSEADMRMPILFPLFAWGLLYFPMALLAVAMSDSMAMANPLIVIPAITRLSTQYMLACVLFFAMVALRFVIEGLLNRFLPIPILPTIIAGFISLYFLAVEMRMLGTMYYLNRRKLGWYKS